MTACCNAYFFHFFLNGKTSFEKRNLLTLNALQTTHRASWYNGRVAGVRLFIFTGITNSRRAVWLALLKDILEICFIISAPSAAFFISILLQNIPWVAGRVLHRGVFIRQHFAQEVLMYSQCYWSSSTGVLPVLGSEHITHLLCLTISLGCMFVKPIFAVSPCAWWFGSSPSLLHFPF